MVGGGGASRAAKGYCEVCERYLQLFEIWARGMRVMLGHRRTRVDALLCGNPSPRIRRALSWRPVSVRMSPS